LDKNHKTLDYETNQVKKLEEEYLKMMARKEKMLRKLEKLKKLNKDDEN
jgi:hypothetical protein